MSQLHFCPAAAPVRPGMLLQIVTHKVGKPAKAAGRRIERFVEPHSVPGGPHDGLFAVNAGKDCDPTQPYATGEQVPVAVTSKGGSLLVLLRGGERVAAGCSLVSGGDGTLVREDRVPPSQRAPAAVATEDADLTDQEARLTPAEGTM